MAVLPPTLPVNCPYCEQEFLVSVVSDHAIRADESDFFVAKILIDPTDIRQHVRQRHQVR